MSDNKKYYYLKLKDNFFNTDDLILLETMQDGYLYSNILLKLYLSSIKNQGKLMFKDTIPYNPQMLASITRHQVGTVEKALNIFKELGLVEVLDNGAIYMMEIQNFIGNSTTEADRIREYRSRIKSDEKVLINQSSVQMYDKSTPEIDIELKLKTELKTELKTDNKKAKANIYKKINLTIIDECLTLEQAKELIDHRIHVKKPMSQKAFKLLSGSISKCVAKGFNSQICIDTMIEKGWQSINPEWLLNSGSKKSNQNNPSMKRSASEQMDPEGELARMLNGDFDEC